METDQEHQKRSREGGVDGVLGDLGQGKLRRTRMRLRLHRMNKYSHVKLHRLAPERVQVKFPKIGAFDIRGDHRTNGPELDYRSLQLRRRLLREGKGDRGKQGEAFRAQLADLGEMVVKVLVPRDRILPRHSMGKDVSPCGQDLVVDALARHGVEAHFHRLDELWEKRPNLQPIVKMQCARAGRPVLDDRKTKSDARDATFSIRLGGT